MFQTFSIFQHWTHKSLQPLLNIKFDAAPAQAGAWLFRPHGAMARFAIQEIKRNTSSFYRFPVSAGFTKGTLKKTNIFSKSSLWLYQASDKIGRRFVAQMVRDIQTLPHVCSLVQKRWFLAHPLVISLMQEINERKLYENMHLRESKNSKLPSST